MNTCGIIVMTEQTSTLERISRSGTACTVRITGRSIPQPAWGFHSGFPGNTSSCFPSARRPEVTIMTILGRLIVLYPSLILSLAAATLGWFVYRPGLLQPVLFLVILYVIPPLTLRLHQKVFPLRERLSRLSDR